MPGATGRRSGLYSPHPAVILCVISSPIRPGGGGRNRARTPERRRRLTNPVDRPSGGRSDPAGSLGFELELCLDEVPRCAGGWGREAGRRRYAELFWKRAVAAAMRTTIDRKSV